MKSVLMTVGSFALTVAVVMNAYLQKKQFYPSVVYITKSSPSMAVLYLQAFVLVILTGKCMRKIFFGQLRAAEMEHLIERSWYAVTETCLAFTVFRDDFSPRFVALFTVLLFLKCFHWLAEDRIDYMERSPVISFVFHIRAISLMTLLALLDTHFINHAYHNTLIKGPSVQLVFGFEYAILLTAIVHVFVKYVLHAFDLQSDNPWENKAVYLLYTELILGGVKVAFYVLFLAIMIKVHTFPLFVIRPMYLTVREFKKALNDVVMSRRAIRNMNTLYPDATAEELSSGDNVCIICREEMQSMCKKLPCNHIFHASCLRSWFQRQQTCPTCRMDVLRLPVNVPTRQELPVQQPMQAVPQPLHGIYPAWPPNFAAAQQVHPQPVVSSSAPVTSVPPNAANPFLGFPAGTIPPSFSMPPQTGMPFYFPPMPPPNFSGLTLEELHNLEGNERRNVEARVQCLRDIQTLLNAAMLHLQQYTSIAAGNFDWQQTFHSRQPGTFTTSDPVVSTSSVTTDSKADASADNVTSASDIRLPSENIDSELEGAVGYTPPANESTAPELINKEEEEEGNDGEEVNKIRRRRLQHFSSSDLKNLDKSE